ncbi:hypothetical protein [Picosynechococcus sp. NKBG042902]|uniref:hypothetical protein n=1 Tax=Picosynechococcus sp. NKBG042902 TaxID=490193 RepID=UPI0004A9FFD8|nr:hypothetical protein [Picosynechococcus sp. NKBG042902]
MQIKGIKRGQQIELLESLDVPDGTLVYLEVVPERSSPTLWWQALSEMRREIEATGEGLVDDSFLRTRDELFAGETVESLGEHILMFEAERSQEKSA